MSPDCNPIENLRDVFRRRVRQRPQQLRNVNELAWFCVKNGIIFPCIFTGGYASQREPDFKKSLLVRAETPDIKAVLIRTVN